MTASRKTFRSIIMSVAVVSLAACVGAWADNLHVTLSPVAGSTIVGEAEVALATECAPRCFASGGTEILVLVDNPRPRGVYEASLAGGTCRAPTNPRRLGIFVGSDGGRSHVDTPLDPLTSGSYVLIVKSIERGRRGYACGRIVRS